MVWHYVHKQQYADKTLTLWKSMNICERASLADLAFLHNKSAISFNMDGEEQPFTNKYFNAYFKNA